VSGVIACLANKQWFAGSTSCMLVVKQSEQTIPLFIHGHSVGTTGKAELIHNLLCNIWSAIKY